MRSLKSALKVSTRRLFALFIAVIAVLVVNDFIVFRSLESLRKQRQWVVRTKDMLVGLESLRGTLGQTQVAAQGYLISDDVGFLSRYEESVELALSQLESLEKRAVENPGQQELVKALSAQVKELATTLSETVSTYVSRGRNAADPEVRRLIFRGRVLMDTVRSTLTALRSEEENLLAQRSAAAEEGQQNADRSVFFALAFNFILTIVAFALVKRQLRSQGAEGWLRDAQTHLSALASGEKAVDELSPRVLEFLAPALSASAAAFWVREGDGLRLVAGVALPAHRLGSKLLMGEGLVGQCALEPRATFLDRIPSDYFRLASALGDAHPRSLACVPLAHAGYVHGVLEFATFDSFGEQEKRLLESVQSIVAVALQTARSRAAERTLLEKTLVQQEELRKTNEELEQQAQALDLQRALLAEKNDELLKSRDAIAEKVKELDQASRYKSEFLANMSHELRTPLNSLLILATLFKENRKGNLDAEDIEFANTIYGSGEDLLNLINDILDLAKVEAGRIEIVKEPVLAVSVASALESLFKPFAQKRNLEFHVSVQGEELESFVTDRQRVEQILKNFLSNAFKFTERGSVSLLFWREKDEVVLAVRDTGIGIAPEKQSVIFEAFQQADGATTRKYGGTGLGLTISRELALLLGGRIEMSSVVGAGSEFRLRLPFESTQQAETLCELSARSGTTTSIVRGNELSPRRTVLVVDDDWQFRQTLTGVAKEKGYRVMEAGDGETALRLCLEHLPDAVLLDVRLPGLSGLGVLEKIKSDARTRHLPTHVISGFDHRGSALRGGAMGYLEKPVHMDALRAMFDRIEAFLAQNRDQFLVVDLEQLRRNAGSLELSHAPHSVSSESWLVDRKILIVDDDLRNTFALLAALEPKGLKVAVARNGIEALSAVEKDPSIELVFMDIMMPEMDGYEAIARLRANPKHTALPIIALTAKAMKGDREKCFEAGANDYLAKPVLVEDLFSLLRVWLPH